MAKIKKLSLLIIFAVLLMSINYAIFLFKDEEAKSFLVKTMQKEGVTPVTITINSASTSNINVEVPKKDIIKQESPFFSLFNCKEEELLKELNFQEYPKRYPKLALIRTCTFDNHVSGMYLSGKYVYITRSKSNIRWIDIIDISSPDKPSLIKSFNNFSPYNIKDRFDEINDIFISNNLLYLALSSGLGIIDISDPKKPMLVSHYNIRDKGGYHADGIYVVDNYLFLGTQRLGVLIFDISNPRKPIMVNSYKQLINDMGGDAFIEDIYIYDNYAYILAIDEFNKFVILDISNKTKPELVFQQKMTFSVFQQAIQVINRIAYVSMINAFKIFDVSDPKNIHLLGGAFDIKNQQELTGFYILYPYVFLGYESGFLVLDISNPEEINILEDIPIPSLVVLGSGSHIYTLGPSKLNIFEIKQLY